MATDFKLPDLGENIEAGDVVAVLVSEGDVIQAGQNVLELETDKAVIELPCPYGGKITKVHVKQGDKVAVGQVVLTIEVGESAEAPTTSPKPPQAAATSRPAETPKPAPLKKDADRPRPVRRPEPTLAEEAVVVQAAVETLPPAPEQPSPRPAPERTVAAPAKGKPEEWRPVPAGPATRKLARQLGVDLHLVNGRGPGGRITAEDVYAYVRQVTTAAPAAPIGRSVAPPLPDFSQWGPIERQPMSGVRRKTAEALSLAWSLIPHVTQFELADITEMEAGRKRYGQSRSDLPGKVTMTVLVVKAVVAVLKEFPQFNASIDMETGEIIYKRYYHIGVAVDTEHGLIVPVIRDVNRKSIRELATELEELADRARTRKIELAQLRGGTFTITNLGGIAGTAFTPIINYPEVAILGLSRSRQEYVIRNGEPEIRLMLPLSLSYDHRIIDGADAARFIKKLAGVLSDPVQLLLEG